jgi:small subunit ribosomal protein S20
VAHSLSAKKRVRQNIKRNALNRHRKMLLKNDTKAFSAALTKGDATAAAEQLKVLLRRLDKGAAKHAIHKNAAARRRSRLAKKVNALKAGSKAGAGTKA